MEIVLSLRRHYTCYHIIVPAIQRQRTPLPCTCQRKLLQSFSIVNGTGRNDGSIYIVQMALNPNAVCSSCDRNGDRFRIDRTFCSVYKMDCISVTRQINIPITQYLWAYTPTF